MAIQSVVATADNGDSSLGSRPKIGAVPPFKRSVEMKKTIPYLVVFAGVAAILLALPENRADGLIKITKERIPMDERLLSLCVGPEAVVGPHAVAEVDIYVNRAVLEYREANPEQFHYPVGSVFVKEKYPTVASKSPDVATRMQKVRSEGAVSDWEFSIYRLPEMTPIDHQGRESCASCHERYEERGFISRESEEALREFLQG